MEKSQEVILSELKSALEDLTRRVESLESRLLQEQIDVEQMGAESSDSASPDFSEVVDLGLDIDIKNDDFPAVLEVEEEEAVEAEEEEVMDLPDFEERPVLMDSFALRRAWKVDMPGTPVQNIISGISLNDRVLFINSLFREDAILFQKSLAAFNSMTYLKEAEDYINEEFPEWNLDSDVVYRFMMAVRRKLV